MLDSLTLQGETLEQGSSPLSLFRRNIYYTILKNGKRPNMPFSISISDIVLSVQLAVKVVQNS